MEPDNLRRSWDAIRAKAGLGATRFHDLRHTCVTLLLELGVPPHVVRDIVGHSDFVSDQVALDADGNVVAAGDPVGQARQAFLNLRAALEAAGASPADLAKITWYVVGYRPELLPELAAARTEVLGDQLPASTLIGVQALAQPAYLVEVEAKIEEMIAPFRGRSTATG